MAPSTTALTSGLRAFPARNTQHAGGERERQEHPDHGEDREQPEDIGLGIGTADEQQRDRRSDQHDSDEQHETNAAAAAARRGSIDRRAGASLDRVCVRHDGRCGPVSLAVPARRIMFRPLQSPLARKRSTCQMPGTCLCDRRDGRQAVRTRRRQIAKPELQSAGIGDVPGPQALVLLVPLRPGPEHQADRNLTVACPRHRFLVRGRPYPVTTGQTSLWLTVG